MSELVAGAHDWSPEVWAWSPSHGRWGPEYGAPKQPVLFRLSTDSVAPSEAYDYWRDLAFYYFDADRLPKSQSREFSAQVTTMATPTGNIYTYRSRAVSGRRLARDVRVDGGDAFDIGVVLRGRRTHRDETGAVYVATSGEFFCYDAAKASRIEWSDHQGIHLTLPRTLVTASIGDIPPATEIVKALATSNLAPFLQAHLNVLARTLRRLTVSERTIVFDHTAGLIRTALHQVLRPGARSGEMEHSAYFVAAKRFIEQQIANPNLDVAMIARVLGCSRSTLYRCFAEQGWTVAEYIRETRMQEAFHRLSGCAKGTKIEEIASACGFVSASHFGRVFRARFGVAPRDFRALSTATEVLPL